MRSRRLPGGRGGGSRAQTNGKRRILDSQSRLAPWVPRPVQPSLRLDVWTKYDIHSLELWTLFSTNAKNI